MEGRESVVTAEPSAQPAAQSPAADESLGASARPTPRGDEGSWSPIVAAIERIEHDQETSSLLSRAAAAVERSARRQARLEAQLTELINLLESADRYAEL